MRQIAELNLRTTDDADARAEDVREALQDLCAALGTPVPLVIRNVRIRCDSNDCSAVGPAAESVTAALLAAVGIGWRHMPDGQDHCPDCTTVTTNESEAP